MYFILCITISIYDNKRNGPISHTLAVRSISYCQRVMNSKPRPCAVSRIRICYQLFAAATAFASTAQSCSNFWVYPFDGFPKADSSGIKAITGQQYICWLSTARFRPGG